MDNIRPILLVEDDEIDFLTVKRILKTLGIVNPLIYKNNGEEALEYLANKNNERPGVILLDLNMPRMNGREFLEAMRRDPDLGEIPVIVASTSDSDRDVVGQNVVGYVVKAIAFAEFTASVKGEFEKLYSQSPVS